MIQKSLTGPKQHNPANFVYLAHGFMNWDKSEMAYQGIKERVDRINDPTQLYRVSLVGKLDGETAKKRICWHGGEVYQVGTFSDVGIIIDPITEIPIKIAWNCDLGSPLNQRDLEKFVQEHKNKIRYVHELLTKTKGDPRAYNEIILRGTSETQVKGVFYRKGSSITKTEGKHIGELVSQIKGVPVPVIALPDIQGGEYDEIAFLATNAEISQTLSEFHQATKYPSMNHSLIVDPSRLSFSPKSLR